jgi:hypothetical protein
MFCRPWVPSASLTQLTSIAVVGAANDHSLALLGCYFPHLVSLTLTHCYYVSDSGLRKLCQVPRLQEVSGWGQGGAHHLCTVIWLRVQVYDGVRLSMVVCGM